MRRIKQNNVFKSMSVNLREAQLALNIVDKRSKTPLKEASIITGPLELLTFKENYLNNYDTSKIMIVAKIDNFILEKVTITAGLPVRLNGFDMENMKLITATY
jgi:hypothetical protein